VSYVIGFSIINVRSHHTTLLLSLSIYENARIVVVEGLIDPEWTILSFT